MRLRRKRTVFHRMWTKANGPVDPTSAAIPQPYPQPEGIDVETAEGLADFLDGLAEGRYQIVDPSS